MSEMIDRIIGLHENRFELLQKYAAPKLGWVSIDTPEEIVYAGGGIPYRITGEGVQSTPKAGAYMHRNVCSYVLSSLEEGLEGIHNFSDGMITANSCDGRRRLFDLWRYYLGDRFLYMLDLPKIVSNESRVYFRDQVCDLKAKIENQFGRRITEDDLREAISLCNTTRRLLQRLYDLRKLNSPPITGAQAMRIVKSSMSVSKRDFNPLLETLLPSLESAAHQEHAGKLRVLICGSYFDHSAIMATIEDSDAIVVCEDTSTGIKYFEGQVDPHGNPEEALADYYLDRCTGARMADSEKRFNHLWQLIEEYRVDAVFYFSLKFCDNNMMDFPYQKKRLQEKNIPVLYGEGERSMANIEQLKTRIQAFIESHT